MNEVISTKKINLKRDKIIEKYKEKMPYINSVSLSLYTYI
jgi:hypothetical protein